MDITARIRDAFRQIGDTEIIMTALEDIVAAIGRRDYSRVDDFACELVAVIARGRGLAYSRVNAFNDTLEAARASGRLVRGGCS